MSPNAFQVLNNPFGYNGEMHDPDANLTYLRNRFYEPETGVFMTRDLLPGQLSNPLTLNAYAYVTNNPLNFIDPLGLEKKPGLKNYLFSGLETLTGILEISAGVALGGTGVGSVVGAWMIANGTSHAISGASDIYNYAAGNYEAVGTNNVVRNAFVGALGKNGEILYTAQDLAAGFAGGYVAATATATATRNALPKVEGVFEGTGKAGFKVGSKSEAMQALKNLPDEVQANIKRFVKKSGNDYTEYSVDVLENGNYQAKMTKPGDVSGFAEYYKIIDAQGNTVETFKDTFDNLGKFVHRKYK